MENSTPEVGWMDAFGFSRKEEIKKDFEEEEKKIYNIFLKRVKCWGYFAIAFSFYTLLNVFIEFSSAPFYELKIDCYIFHPDHKCKMLEDKTQRLYISELFYGLMMII
jgi:hypothetical protein